VIYGRQRGLAGVALEIVDGGELNGVTVSNLTIQGVSVPVFMRLGNRARRYESDQPKPGVGTFRNVVVENVVGDGTSEIGCAITGLPGHMIENVCLRNVNLGFDGGGTLDDASREIPEKPDSYPESTMFGTLPAYGLFCRHVKGLKLQNVRLRTAKPELRHAVVFDDAEDVTVDGLDADGSPGAATTVRLTGVRGARIRGCTPRATAGAFLRLEGEACRRIVLRENDLRGVGKIADVAPEVADDTLSSSANRLPAER
jgi:hypothetical protein